MAGVLSHDMRIGKQPERRHGITCPVRRKRKAFHAADVAIAEEADGHPTVSDDFMNDSVVPFRYLAANFFNAANCRGLNSRPRAC